MEVDENKLPPTKDCWVKWRSFANSPETPGEVSLDLLSSRRGIASVSAHRV